MRVIINPKTKEERITIPYEPLTLDATVDGKEIRKARKQAGYKSGMKFAIVCGWSQSMQVRYEKNGKHEIPLKNVWKMIRVCNGEK
jgi:hypothetical protein